MEAILVSDTKCANNLKTRMTSYHDATNCSPAQSVRPIVCANPLLGDYQSPTVEAKPVLNGDSEPAISGCEKTLEIAEPQKRVTVREPHLP